MMELLITSSLLILAVLAARALLAGRISRRMQYALWGLVLVRLLLPVGLPESRASVMNMLPDSPRVSLSGPARTEPEQVLSAPAQTQTAPVQTQIQIPEQSAPAEPSSPQHPEWSLDPAALLPVVWAAGAALTGGALLAANLRFALRLRRTRCRLDLDPEKTGGLPVYLCHELAGPCLYGLIRPAIYLNPAALETADRLDFVLAHERTHFRHRDHIWCALRCVVLAGYWFDPLVWAAAAVSRRDCELACDEAVTAGLEEDRRRDYGRCLVDLIPSRAPGAGLLAATAMSGSAGVMQRRLKAILTAKRPRRAAIALTAAGAALLCACTFTGPTAKTIAGVRDYMAQGETQWKFCALGDENRMQELLVVRAPAPEGQTLADGEEYIRVYYWDSAAESHEDFLQFAGKVENGSLTASWTDQQSDPEGYAVLNMSQYRGNEDPATVQMLQLAFTKPDQTRVIFTLERQAPLIRAEGAGRTESAAQEENSRWQLQEDLRASLRQEDGVLYFTIPEQIDDLLDGWTVTLGRWTLKDPLIQRLEPTGEMPPEFTTRQWKAGREYGISLAALPGRDQYLLALEIWDQSEAYPWAFVAIDDYQWMDEPVFSTSSQARQPQGEELEAYQAAFTAFSETVQWDPETGDLSFTVPQTAGAGEWEVSLYQRDNRRDSWVSQSGVLPDDAPRPGQTVTLTGRTLAPGTNYRLDAVNTRWNTTLSVEFTVPMN